MKAKLLRSKILPAIFRILVPEFLIIQTLIELLKARRTAKTLRLLGTSGQITLNHGFAVNMGALYLKSSARKNRQLESRHVAQVYNFIRKDYDIQERPPFLPHFE